MDKTLLFSTIIGNTFLALLIIFVTFYVIEKMENNTEEPVKMTIPNETYKKYSEMTCYEMKEEAVELFVNEMNELLDILYTYYIIQCVPIEYVINNHNYNYNNIYDKAGALKDNIIFDGLPEDHEDYVRRE